MCRLQSQEKMWPILQVTKSSHQILKCWCLEKHQSTLATNLMAESNFLCSQQNQVRCLLLSMEVDSVGLSFVIVVAPEHPNIDAQSALQRLHTKQSCRRQPAPSGKQQTTRKSSRPWMVASIEVNCLYNCGTPNLEADVKDVSRILGVGTDLVLDYLEFSFLIAPLKWCDIQSLEYFTTC